MNRTVRKPGRLVPFLGLLLLIACVKWADGQVPSLEPIQLEDVTARAALNFRHFSGGTGQHYIVETVASGLATFDYDGDGLIDVYLLSGSPLRGAKATPEPRCKLFRNLGNFQFMDVTDQSGTGERGFGLGVVAGDYDNDGDQDLFVNNFGPCVLLENNGDGTFERRTFSAPKGAPRVGAGVSLADIDGDGLLDCYFANYIRFSFDRGTNRKIFGIPAAPGPKDYDPDTHVLLTNEGDGRFRDISLSSGIGQQPGPGMGMVAFDFDSDHDTDFFVCNDSAANFLFENLGNSRFSEIALLAGVAYDVTGAQQATMGVDVADFNGDGLTDLITTSFIEELPALCKNSGQGYFDDVAAAYGLGAAARNVTWGVGFSDFDNDSWPDLYIASGHLISGSNRVNDTEKFAARNLVFRNEQGKRFVDVTKNVGSAGAAIQVSRGLALDDLDNDGRTDVVILNLDDAPQVIRNISPSSNYLQLELIGSHGNRDAIGSKVILHVGSRKLVQEVVAGRGYQSHFGHRLSFGLGSQTSVDDIEVHWHAGAVQHYGKTEANQRLLMRETDDRPIQLQ